MGESFVQVAPDSSGKKLHANDRVIGGNTVLDEVTIPGEYYLPTAVATAEAISLATADAHLFQVMATAALAIRIRSIEITLWTLTTSSTLHRLELWRLTTAGTGGTVVTPRPLDSADTVSGTCMTLPTVKGTEGVQLYSWGPVVASAVANVINDGAVLRKKWDFNGKGLIIPVGTANGIALKNKSTQAAGQFAVNIEWVETAWI